MSSGKIVQVIGPVVDVEFSLDQSLPDINNALVVYKNDENKSKVVLEAALELGDDPDHCDGINRWFTKRNGSH